jgi:hypothetical protein
MYKKRTRVVTRKVTPLEPGYLSDDQTQCWLSSPVGSKIDPARSRFRTKVKLRKRAIRL